MTTKTLEIGGGDKPYYRPNMDVRPLPTVDIVHDLNKFPWPVLDNDYEFVFSRYTIEHVSWRSLPQFINEMYRITKPGGRVMVISPNLRAQAEILSRKRDWNLKNDVCMIFGDQNYGENAHSSSCSPELYHQLYAEAGFKNVVTYPVPYWHGDMVLEALK